jgi:alkylation response protein AidB-like acyl-CoA dehydrogenase
MAGPEIHDESAAGAGSAGSGGPAALPAGVAAELAALAERSAEEGPWASGGMALLAREGMLGRFVPADCGGMAADEPTLIATLEGIAAACLTTALAVSQWAAAVRIIATADDPVRKSLLPALARGETFTTVGISQLTTSRQHLGRPVLVAERGPEGWRLDGLCPWVTGADACDTLVTGAATSDGGQLFFVVPTAAAGVEIDPPLEMLALSGSRTAVVRLAAVAPAHVIEPPERNAARTGGLSTSALALGTARAAVEIVSGEAARRESLQPIAAGLERELAGLEARLQRAARDGIAAADRDALRGDANDLVLRAAQAALTASKGAGFVKGHPTERLVRESLFFLVWSCPQSVTTARLCELAGVS